MRDMIMVYLIIRSEDYHAKQKLRILAAADSQIRR